MPTLIPTVSTQSAAYSRLSSQERAKYSKLGTFSCISLITNKMIGTGLFSTPSIIFKYCNGNVPIFLGLWILGAIIILSGLLVYLEYALNLPFRNGGEKNYLLRVFRVPKGLCGCIYAFQMVFLGFSSGNSFAFGKYIWYAVSGEPQPGASEWPAKWIGVACITFCIWLHVRYPNQGMALFNFLGMFKIVILFLIIAIGLLVGLGAITVPESAPVAVSAEPQNAYSISVALLQVVYSFKGWENANYVLSELENPYQALTVTAPVSVLLVTCLYFMVVVSYLVVIPKKELLSSGVLVAGIFFNKVFGESITSRVLPILISLSTLGNVMVVSFAHSRVNQELAQENYLPFSKYFQNLNHSLLLHWAITVIILVGPPSAEIYEFVVNLYIYPGTWINLLLTGGLIYLKLNRDKENWAKEEIIEPEIIVEPSSPKSVQSSVNSHHTQSSAESIQSYTEFDSLISHADSTRVTPPTHKFSAPWACIFVFLAANLFLALFPFVPPPASEGGAIPYWCFPVVGTGCLLMGAVFYYGRNHVYQILGKPMPSYEEQDVIE
ncbi:hypothetical protein OXX69_000123 [Metschnikowia pulcherrima]